LLLVALAAASPAAAFDHRPTTEALTSELRNPDRLELANRTVLALDVMIKLATRRLDQRGHRREAARIRFDWGDTYRAMLPALVLAEGLGDHAPLSQWLADLHDQLEELLGERMMKLLHLDDIKVVNYAVPVVLNLDVLGGDQVDVVEYELHWTPWCSVVSFWAVWTACTVTTSGLLSFVVCSPAGMAAEHVVAKWIAPPLADNAWNIFWRQ